MRAKTQWSRNARLLWLFALIVAGVLAWLDWRGFLGGPAGEPPDDRPDEVEVEVVYE